MKRLLTLLLLTASSAAFAQSSARRDLKEEETREVPKWVDKMPAFNGDWGTYLRNNLIFPQSVLDRMDTDTTLAKAGVNERIVVQFIVCEDGGLCNLKVMKGSRQFPELEAEALRVIRQSPPWTPGQQDGRKVKVFFSQPIAFRME